MVTTDIFAGALHVRMVDSTATVDATEAVEDEQATPDSTEQLLHATAAEAPSPSDPPSSKSSNEQDVPPPPLPQATSTPVPLPTCPPRNDAATQCKRQYKHQCKPSLLMPVAVSFATSLSVAVLAIAASYHIAVALRPLQNVGVCPSAPDPRLPPIAPGNYNIKLSGEELYMRANPGYIGAHVDLQTFAAAWEKWTVTRVDSTNRIALLSAHNMYLRATNINAALLYQRWIASHELDWKQLRYEQFELVPVEGNPGSFGLRTFGGGYLCAFDFVRGDGTRPLREMPEHAWAPVPSNCQFTFVPVD